MIWVPSHQLTYSVPNNIYWKKEEMNESGKAELFILIYIINTDILIFLVIENLVVSICLSFL